MNTKQIILQLSNVWKIYQMGEVKVPALKDISINIDKGDFISIIGSSGSGKSTMLNLIGCLDIPTKGSIHLKNQNISELLESDLASLRGKTIGFIFQQYNLLPNMTAFQNVLLPLELQEINDSEAKKRTEKVLKMVNLEKYMHHKPTQLSGGQQQRVSIARCLSNNPEIILADEPTGALDSVTGKDVLKLLEKLWKEEQKTIIMVTHDLELAKYAHRIIQLKDGKIISDKRNKKIKLIKEVVK